MKRIFVVLIACVLTTFGVWAVEIADFAKDRLTEVVPETIVLKQDNGWLYSKNELEHLARGPLAGGNVVKVSAASKKNNADPIAALDDFNKQLQELGITLLVVPVPLKIAVYPVSGIAQGEAMGYLKPFYDELRSKGINVVDLSDVFIANSADNVYCRTDAHWSPSGIALAADELAKAIPLRGDSAFTVNSKEVMVAGDLARSLKSDDKETITVNSVNENVFSEDSPVLILGDSHTLIFSEGGDMLADNSGLCEELAVQLKMPVERMGIKGSAATAVRANLYRKAAKDPQWLKNKKYVIYCFSCREFTEAKSGWMKVPVMKK